MNEVKKEGEGNTSQEAVGQEDQGKAQTSQSGTGDPELSQDKDDEKRIETDSEERKPGIVNTGGGVSGDVPEEIINIAKRCHENNRDYCASIGDMSQPIWEDAPDWQKTSAINGVLFHLANPEALPSHSHDCWLSEKVAEGWIYGEVKDPDKKEHPCMVPYRDLPEEQKFKDQLFIQTVNQFRELANEKIISSNTGTGPVLDQPSEEYEKGYEDGHKDGYNKGLIELNKAPESGTEKHAQNIRDLTGDEN